MKKHKIKKNQIILFTFLIPGLTGFIVFYALPFLISIYYSFTNINNGRLFTFQLMLEVIKNTYFQTAYINTLIFISICVPSNIILSFFIASKLKMTGNFKWLVTIMFLIPFIVPSGTLAYFWKLIFDYHGLVNRIIYNVGGTPVYWFRSDSSRLIFVLIFLHKNLGINIFLFLTGFHLIPRDYYDYAAMEGANAWHKFKIVTLPLSISTVFFAVLIAIVYTFGMFKEIYILFGNYPDTAVYMLQHYIQNQFQSLSFSKMSIASILITGFMAVLIYAFFVIQRRRDY